jgi:hypothetical protein
MEVAEVAALDSVEKAVFVLMIHLCFGADKDR